MNNKPKAIFFILGTALVALLIIVQVLTGGWNAISNLYKYLMVGTVVLSFVSPRTGLIFLILCAGYMDLFKRFLVMAGNVFFQDLIYIVGLPPLIAASCFAGAITKFLLNPHKTKEDTRLLIITLALSALAAVAMVLQNGFSFGSLQFVAIGAGFVGLIFTVPYVYKDMADIYKTFRYLLIMFVPVAIYACWQKFVGFSDFEIMYLETGLSSESRILGNQDFRYFSTLNSSQNLAKVMGMFCVMVLISFRGEISRHRVRIMKVFLAFVFLYAGYISGARTGLIMALVAGFAYLCFRSKALTITSYTLFAIVLVGLIFSAEDIVKHGRLGDLEAWIYSTFNIDRDNQSFVLGTLNVRFVSLAGIADGSRLLPFGAWASGEEELLQSHEVHEILSKVLLQIGYVPLAFIMAIGSYMLIKLHKLIWAMPKGSSERRLALWALAYAASVIVGGMSASANLHTYPIVYFLYLFPGLAILAHRCAVRKRQEEQTLEFAEQQKELEDGSFSGSKLSRNIPSGKRPSGLEQART